jgi:hypothetical protein
MYRAKTAGENAKFAPKNRANPLFFDEIEKKLADFLLKRYKKQDYDRL